MTSYVAICYWPFGGFLFSGICDTIARPLLGQRFFQLCALFALADETTGWSKIVADKDG